MFVSIFKFNPYHDKLGRFTTRAHANFVSIGGSFDKTVARERQSQVAYTPESTLKAAKAAAKKIGAPEIVTNKAQLLRELTKAKDRAWERMTPEERQGIFADSYDLPSKSAKELRYAKHYITQLSKWERIYEGKDLFDTPEVAKRLIQNAINYNYSIPKFKKVVDKFGEAPVIVAAFGKRTGLSQGASGQYEGGLVFLNSEWQSSAVMEHHEYTTFNKPPDDNRGKSDEDLKWASGSDGLNSTHRHEYGHYVHSTAMPRTKAKEWDDLYTKVTGLAASASYEASDYGLNHKTPLARVSSYSQANSKEGFAEVFSVMSNPKFSRTQYPKELKDLFDWMDKEVFS